MVFEKNNKLVSLIEKTEESKEILFESNFDIKDNNDKKHQINLTISPVFDENENRGYSRGDAQQDRRREAARRRRQERRQQNNRNTFDSAEDGEELDFE